MMRAAFLLVFVLALYANTLFHGFVLDDRVVLTENAYVQEGWKGIGKIITEDSFAGHFQTLGLDTKALTGGRYRPLSLVVFALVKPIAGGQAWVFHLLNLLWMAGGTLLLYGALRRAFNPAGATAAWAAALLFAVHPVHTEVVANIKSADELLAFLLGVGALYLSLDKDLSIRKQIFVGFLYFLACLAKESAIIWAVLIPLAAWIGGGDRNVPRWRIPFILAIGAVLYLALRWYATEGNTQGQMMHDPLNNPFLKIEGQWQVLPQQPAGDSTVALSPVMGFNGRISPFSSAEKSATILYVLGKYAQLMLYPQPLTHDYYPFQIRAQSWSAWGVWWGVLCAFLLVGAGIWGIWKRQWAGLGLLWFGLGLLPVLNVFFPVGVFMAERFLFLPSAGCCLAAGVGVARLWGGAKWPMLGLVLAMAYWTLSRNTAWQSSEQLFRTDLVHSPNSAKLNHNLALEWYLQAQQTQDSTAKMELIRKTIPLYEKATALHPLYYEGWQGVGAAHFFTGNYPAAARAYRILSAMYPNDPNIRQNLNTTLAKIKK